MATVESQAATSPGEDFLKIIVDPPGDVEVDIVAVHGLNPTNTKNHAEMTWTTKGGTSWLKDMLPKKLPTARIMVFGYNANVAFQTSTAGVLHQARKLLIMLEQKRKRGMQHRPLIFIAHSLGGIVVKRALVVAPQSDKWKFIKSSTYGIVFFATPHRGGALVPFGQIAAKIVRAICANPPNNFLEAVEKDSTFAASMTDDFSGLLEEFQVISFFETRNLPNIGIVVDQKSAVLGLSSNREISMSLDLDHSQICKFDHTSGEYEVVEGLIEDMVESAIERHKEASLPGDVRAIPFASPASPALSDDTFGASGFSHPLSLSLGEPSHSTPRISSPSSPELEFSPFPSAPTSPDPAASSSAPGMSAFTMPSSPVLSSPDLISGQGSRDTNGPGGPFRMNSASSAFSDSVQSLTLSEGTNDDRRRSSSTLATERSSVANSARAHVQSRAPGLFRSIGMNVNDSDGVKFRRAAADGHKSTVERMLRDGAVIDNSGVLDGYTALADAALHGQEEVVEFLLDEGANPAFECISTTKKYGSISNTPLSLASGKGHTGCMTILMKRHQYTTEEFDQALRAARYRGRSDAIRLIESEKSGLRFRMPEPR